MKKTVSFADEVTLYLTNGRVIVKTLSDIPPKNQIEDTSIDPNLLEFVLPSPNSELNMNINSVYNLPVNDDIFTFIIPEAHTKKKVSKIVSKTLKFQYLKLPIKVPKAYNEPEIRPGVNKISPQQDLEAVYAFKI